MQVSQKVKDFKDIIKEADKMFALIKKEGYAVIHHSEMKGVEQPMDFFVVNKAFRFMFRGYGLIVNPKLVKIEEKRDVNEGCPQFPLRVHKRIRRYNKITIEAYVESPDTGRLESVILDLEGVAAIWTQHSIDHAQGRSQFIGGKNKKQ